MLAITCSGGSSTPYGRSASTRSSGTNTSSIVDVVAARAAHAERVPVVVHGDAVDRHGHGHVQHALAALGIVVDEHRRQHVAGGRLAGEHLAAADRVAAVDLDRLAAGPGEVAAAGGHEHDPVVDDPAQRRLGPGQAAPVAPRRERRDVLVHRRSPAPSSRSGLASSRCTIADLGGSSRPRRRARSARRGSSSPASRTCSNDSATQVPSRSWRAACSASTGPHAAARATQASPRVSGSVCRVEFGRHGDTRSRRHASRD